MFDETGHMNHPIDEFLGNYNPTASTIWIVSWADVLLGHAEFTAHTTLTTFAPWACWNFLWVFVVPKCNLSSIVTQLTVPMPVHLIHVGIPDRYQDDALLHVLLALRARLTIETHLVRRFTVVLQPPA